MTSTSTLTKEPKTFRETDKQLEALELLGGPARHVMLYGGGRSGKTFILLYAIIVRALKTKSRHLILRLHFNHVKTSLWHDTLPKVLALVCPDLKLKKNDTDFFVTFPNGSEIWIGGLDEKKRTEKVLGTEYSTIFFNECSQLTYDSVETAKSRLAEKSGLVNRCYYDCNPPHKQHWAHQVFIEGVDPESKERPRLKLSKPERYAAMLMNPIDNLENIDSEYLEELEGLSKRKRDRFLHGLWLDTSERALWKYDDILRCSPADAPEMDRIVIAVDPPKFHDEKADECGIGAAGRSGNRLYVFEDLSDRLSPKGWGNKAVNAYFRLHADRIIGEVNNGGEMVEHVIHQVNENVPFKAVTATRGKVLRAEPIAAIYEQHRAFHVGIFPELEDQLTTPMDELEHDDRLDWLVWAATELMLDSREISVGSIEL